MQHQHISALASKVCPKLSQCSLPPRCCTNNSMAVGDSVVLLAFLVKNVAGPPQQASMIETETLWGKTCAQFGAENYVNEDLCKRMLWRSSQHNTRLSPLKTCWKIRPGSWFVTLSLANKRPMWARSSLGSFVQWGPCPHRSYLLPLGHFVGV